MMDNGNATVDGESKKESSKPLQSQELPARDMKQLHRMVPRRLITSIAFIIGGTVLAIVAILLLVTGLDNVVFNGLVAVEIKFIDPPREINLAWTGDILLGVAGGILIALGLTRSNSKLRANHLIPRMLQKDRETPERSMHFVSMNLIRFVAGMIMVTLGIVNFMVHGGGFTIDNAPEGAVLFHNGPSYFYAYGVFPGITGAILAVRSLFSNYFGRISITPNFITYYEHRGIVTMTTEIPRGEVKRAFLRNNHSGPKPAWLLLLLPPAILFLQQGFTFLVVPGDPSTTPIAVSWTGIMTGAVIAVIALLLVLFPHSYLKIETGDAIFESWFVPVRLKGSVLDGMASVLDLDANREFITTRPGGDTFRRTQRYYFNLVTGVAFIGIAWVNLAFLDYQFAMGSAFIHWTLLVLGVTWAIQALQRDFTKARGYHVQGLNPRDGEYTASNSREIHSLHLHRRLWWMNDRISFMQIRNVKKSMMVRKLDFFSIFLCILLWCATAYQVTISWIIRLDGTKMLMQRIGMTLAMAGISAWASLALIHPRPGLRVTEQDGTVYNIPFALNRTFKKTLRLHLSMVRALFGRKGDTGDISKSLMDIMTPIKKRMAWWIGITLTTIAGTILYWHLYLT
ncbi:hypothetical protein GF325_07215 [Candidatus Bathyarchaeota archaeon]|nr:hypothetical protein [Candidatus Bathyarchaeota archaeon]